MRQLYFWNSDIPDVQTSPSLPIEPVAQHGQLEQWFSQQLKKPVKIVWTRNRSTMLSSSSRSGVLSLRLHQLFVDSSDDVFLALARYLKSGNPEAKNRIDQHIAHAQKLFSKTPRDLEHRGRFHDLLKIHYHLNQLYFHLSSTAKIGWGMANKRRYKRSIQLGCYVQDEHLIRMHPALDQVFVPNFYVSWVVFHEMLHEVFGIESHKRRRVIHSKEFVAIEESYPDYQRSKHWEQNNLHRLLRFR